MSEESKKVAQKAREDRTAQLQDRILKEAAARTEEKRAEIFGDSDEEDLDGYLIGFLSSVYF
jgi:hypothetical protein